MTTRRAKKRDKTPTAPRKLHAWHVVTATGGDDTVKAHQCDHYDGVLTFRELIDLPDGDTEAIIVRAFGAGRWVDMKEVPLDDLLPQP